MVLLNRRMLDEQTQAPAGQREHSDVGLLVDEHGAACEGSVNFDLLSVGHRDQRVVLQLLVHLQETQWEGAEWSGRKKNKKITENTTRCLWEIIGLG